MLGGSGLALFDLGKLFLPNVSIVGVVGGDFSRSAGL
jgi:hypothetical protein